MVFASICEHASRAFTFASTSTWQAVSKILRARASEHPSNFCEQFEQRPNLSSTFKLNETILYPSWDTPGEPTGTQEEWYSLGTSFSPRGRKLLALETTSLDYGNIPTGFIRVSSRPSFFALFYFISMSNFDIVFRLSILSPREGLFFINFMSFTEGHGIFFLFEGKKRKAIPTRK